MVALVVRGSGRQLLAFEKLEPRGRVVFIECYGERFCRMQKTQQALSIVPRSIFQDPLRRLVRFLMNLGWRSLECISADLLQGHERNRGDSGHERLLNTCSAGNSRGHRADLGSQVEAYRRTD